MIDIDKLVTGASCILEKWMGVFIYYASLLAFFTSIAALIGIVLGTVAAIIIGVISLF